ncbi:hypothetical protein [Pectobacterium versatile]
MSALVMRFVPAGAGKYESMVRLLGSSPSGWGNIEGRSDYRFNPIGMRK